MGKNRAILWFRQDLRLHDNEALSEALKCADEIIPLYIFEERNFTSKSSFGFRNCSAHRARFIIESIHDLRKSLRELGSDLVVRTGKAEDIIFNIAREFRTHHTFCNRERTLHEVKTQDALEQNLWSIGQEVRYSRGKMLYYTSDLPFPINHTPDLFANFRKETERLISIRDLIPINGAISNKTFKEIDPGTIPSITDYFEEDECNDTITVSNGGEMNGLERLNYFLWEKDYIKDFKENQYNMTGDCSSRLSPYLSQGCLSPKKVYHEVKAYENENGSNESTKEIIHHLMYRDHLRLLAKKYGHKIFKYSGIKGSNNIAGNKNKELFIKWASANTGNTFVDANMTQLNKTGYISFKGRQTVASYLVHELGVNWKMGAEYFESMLLDYDPCSNWVNWNNISGVGVESKDKVINSQTAGQRLDPSGEFVKQWLLN